MLRQQSERYVVVTQNDITSIKQPSPNAAESQRSSEIFFGLPPVTKDKAPLHPDRDALIAYLLHEWDTSAYVQRRKGKGWGNGREEVLLDSDSLLPEERHAALILETVGISKGTRVQLMGRTAMPCSFDDLVNAGIGTTQLATPRLDGEDIVAEVVTEYAGREIGRSRPTAERYAAKRGVGISYPLWCRIPRSWRATHPRD